MVKMQKSNQSQTAFPDLPGRPLLFTERRMDFALCFHSLHSDGATQFRYARRHHVCVPVIKKEAILNVVSKREIQK